MAQIIKIGNSQGIRIPKPIVELAQLQGKELDFVVLGDGLLITAQKNPRATWRNSKNSREIKSVWKW
ncbi:MAG: AbrB/MazE/SpoVT family DNA-binding domain-containing protein [Gammaproteobacteria bacterium]|nr:AbrB/MazE/SpoVT family DNA-binding domain-containing protein [Gammaproteobacteria bacterium]